jgi:U5 small nuclear ribonucleoprotein component
MDVQEDLYDEFGNYIGPEIDSDEDGDAPEIEDGDDESGDEEERMEYEGGVGGDALLEDAGGDGDDETRVVLHEDKKYYPTAMEVYGEDVETTVQDEDTMPITQGVVAAIKAKNFDIVEKKQPTHVYSQEFLVSMMKHPNLVRNVAVIGHLHHGKTTFVDMLVGQAHSNPKPNPGPDPDPNPDPNPNPNQVEQTHYFEAPKTGVAKAEATQKEDRRYTDSRYPYPYPYPYPFP